MYKIYIYCFDIKYIVVAVMKKFEMSSKICTGNDALDILLELPFGKAILITDPYMVSSGIVSTVTSRLEKNKFEYSIFSEIEPDPSMETVAKGLADIIARQPDYIIALGGGSAIDAAKGMIYFLRVSKKDIKVPKFIAIPTTSGTGSEVTSYAVISDKQRGVKIPISDNSLVPELVILDPGYTKTLPPAMIAYTGMDVLTHALEAYVSGNTTDCTDMFAFEAARLTIKHLPAMYRNADNEEHRMKMHSASTMAGIAFTNAGLGLSHGIAHTMGAQYHITHGKLNAIILPYVIAFNAGLDKSRVNSVEGRYAQLALRLGLEAKSDKRLCVMLIAAVEFLRKQFNIPASLRECDVNKDRFYSEMESNADKILEDACTKANPIKVGKEDVIYLLKCIYNGELAGLIN